MQDVVSRFSQCRALVIGDVMLDEYLSGEASRLSPEAPVPILRVLDSTYVLGGAGNTAANLVSLGARVTMLCLLGRDMTGDRLARRAAGLGIELVTLDDGRPTPRKTRVVGQQQQMVRLDYEDTHPIDAATEAKALAEATSRIAACDIVILPDYSKGLLTEALTQGIIKAAHRLNKPVVIDPRPNHGKYYVDCDYLTPNWKECLGLLGRPRCRPTPEAIDDAGRSLARKLNANVVLTLGPSGHRLLQPRRAGALPSADRRARSVRRERRRRHRRRGLLARARVRGVDEQPPRHRQSSRRHRRRQVRHGDGDARRDAAEPRAAARARRAIGTARAVGVAEGHGQALVTINGSFDLLHAGHLYILQQAREQGDVADRRPQQRRVGEALQGPGSSARAGTERADLLLGLRCVDYVHIFDEADPIAFLEAVRPDVHVNGSEYGEDCIEAPTVKEHGGRIHLVGRIAGLSTSGLLEKIRATMPKVEQPS